MRHLAIVALLSLLGAGCTASEPAVRYPPVSSGGPEASLNSSAHEPTSDQPQVTRAKFPRASSACAAGKLASSIPATKLIRAFARELPHKGEYESTEDYKVKLLEATDSALKRLGYPASEVAVTFPVLSPFQSYDPDTETLKLYIDGVQPGFETPDAPRYIVAESHYASRGSYLAHNGFGAEVAVTEGANRNLAVLWNAKWAALSPLLKISSAEARHLKHNLSVLAVGRLQFPFLFRSETERYPTYSMPDDDKNALSVLMIDTECSALYDTKTKVILKSLSLDSLNLLH